MQMTTTGLKKEVPVRELLATAAERAIRYLERLNERGVAPDPGVVACLAELAIPLPARPDVERSLEAIIRVAREQG